MFFLFSPSFVCSHSVPQLVSNLAAAPLSSRVKRTSHLADGLTWDSTDIGTGAKLATSAVNPLFAEAEESSSQI